jgi:hypothetical protein
MLVGSENGTQSIRHYRGFAARLIWTEHMVNMATPAWISIMVLLKRTYLLLYTVVGYIPISGVDKR